MMKKICVTELLVQWYVNSYGTIKVRGRWFQRIAYIL